MKVTIFTVVHYLVLPMKSPVKQTPNKQTKNPDSLTKPKWKIKTKQESHSHTPRESEQTHTAWRNPLIAPTILRHPSRCLHLKKPNSWAPGSCGGVRTYVLSVWKTVAGRANKDRQSTSKAQLKTQQQAQCMLWKAEQTSFQGSAATRNNKNHGREKGSWRLCGQERCSGHSS